MYEIDGKRQLESILRALGYGDSDFSVTCLGGDISMVDRIELKILDEKFDGAFSEIHQALMQSENARQVIEQLASRGLARRDFDDG